MNTRLTRSTLLALLLTSTFPLSASAEGVYKSVAADGTILFSDTPPAPDVPIVAQADGPLARANAQVDLAEHAFALSRRGLGAARMTQGDSERVAFYMKDVQIATRQLMDLLRDRQSPVQVAVR